MEEIKFFCAEALRPAIAPLILRFQETARYAVTVEYANVGTIADRVRKSEVGDLVVHTENSIHWREGRDRVG